MVLIAEQKESLVVAAVELQSATGLRAFAKSGSLVAKDPVEQTGIAKTPLSGNVTASKRAILISCPP